MSEAKKIRVAVNGYGVIGKRVADAVVRQQDMLLAGVSDVVTDWRARMATRHGFRLFGATDEHATGCARSDWTSRERWTMCWLRLTWSWIARQSMSPQRTSTAIAAAA